MIFSKEDGIFISAKMKEIINSYGREAFNLRETRSIIADFFPREENKDKRKLVELICESGVINDLSGSLGSDFDLKMKQARNTLKNKVFMADEYIDFSIYCIGLVLENNKVRYSSKVAFSSVENENARFSGEIDLNDFTIRSGRLIEYRGQQETVIIPQGVEIICENAFLTGAKITKIILPPSIKEIDNRAFSKCVSLKEINLPSSLTRIGSYAFSCTQIEKLDFPSSIMVIGTGAFEYTSIKEAILPHGITHMGEGAFKNCHKLVKVKLPINARTISNKMFEGCSNLEEIDIGKSVDKIMDRAFSKCTSLKRIDLGNCMTEIGDFAFADCTSLEEIKLPPSLEILKDYAFCGCVSLKELYIPDSLEAIGKYAFSLCHSLTLNCEAGYEKPNWKSYWKDKDTHVNWNVKT